MKIKRSLLVLVLVTIGVDGYCQKDMADHDVFVRIVELKAQKESFSLSCERQKTYFDEEEFRTENGTEVPARILAELKNASAKSAAGTWDAKLYSSSSLDPLIKGRICLTRRAIQELHESSETRQRTISISDPLFDLARENCVVSVSCLSFKGSASGHSYFLKKVDGRWKVLFVYGYWLT